MEENNIATAISDNENSVEQVIQENESPSAITEEPFLEIKYLKENKSLSKEEAKNLAEMGMHYSAIKDKLELIASANNTTPKQFLDSFIKENDLKIENETVSLGENDAEREATRIANEFLKMQEDFSDEIKSISDIPESVMDAASNGMPLAYAYLLNKHLNEKEIKKQKAAEEKAAKNTVGSVSTDQKTDPVGENFLKSLWGR